MTTTLHTKETAPVASLPLLDKSLKDFGMIPNLHAVMAESPAVLEAYQALHTLFQQTSFDNEEITVIWQTVNVEHGCYYCVPAHTGVANIMNVDEAITNALRNGAPLPTARLNILREATLELVRERGKPSREIIAAFYAEGFNSRQLMEIVLGISQKVLSNYVNHLFETPVDKAFEKYIWRGAINQNYAIA